MRFSLSGRTTRGIAALGLVSLLGLSACSAGSSNSSEGSGGSGGGSSAPAKDSLNVALTGVPVNLDFTTTAGAAIPQAMMNNVYEGLVKMDQEGKMQPSLAKSWTVSDDGKTYTFDLQSGVKFSNGAEFTAEDVKFSIERVKSDAWKNGLKASMDVVSKVDVVSPTQVKVTLAKPSQAWLFSMTSLTGAMFDESGVSDLANKPVGTGPYNMAEWKTGESIKFTSRDDYWGAKPKLKTVLLRYFADPNATSNALKSGDVDVIYNLQAPDLVQGFESDSKYQVLKGTTNGEVLLSMNNKKAPFDDVRVRKAVMYAIDRKAVMDTAYAGYGALVGGPVPPTDPYYEDLNSMYPHDPEKAKALLKEAGAEGAKITFSVPTLPYAQAVSEIVVAQLKEVGLDAKIESTEFPAVWLDKVFTKQDYQMSVVMHIEARDVLTMFGTPGFYLGYDSAKIKDQIAAADAADEAGYVDGVKKIVRTVMEDAAADTLFIFPNLIVADANVQGIPVNAVAEAFDFSTISWK